MWYYIIYFTLYIIYTVYCSDIWHQVNKSLLCFTISRSENFHTKQTGIVGWKFWRKFLLITVQYQSLSEIILFVHVTLRFKPDQQPSYFWIPLLTNLCNVQVGDLDRIPLPFSFAFNFLSVFVRIYYCQAALADVVFKSAFNISSNHLKIWWRTQLIYWTK